MDQATAAHLVEALRSGAAVAIQAPRGASTLEIAAATAAAIRRRSTQFLLGGEPSARGSRDLLFDEGGTAAEEMLLVRAAAGSAGFGGVGGGGEIQIPPPPAAWDLREFDLDALNNNNEPDILAGFEELPGGFFGGAGGGYFPVAQPQQQPRPRRSVSPPPGLAPGHRISSMDTFQEAASGAAKVAAAKGRRRSAGSRAGLGMPGSTAQIIVPLLPGGGSTRTVILRRPTITIQEDGRILIGLGIVERVGWE